jgi:hypothetical protein
MHKNQLYPYILICLFLTGGVTIGKIFNSKIIMILQ